MPLQRAKLADLFRRPEVNRRTILLLLAIIAIFSGALLMRVYPARYGFYLNEFDPYFDYYATRFIVNNADQHGLGVILSSDPNINYFLWRDYRTWYPEGRDVASSSQVGLHFAGAVFYLAARNLFGLNMTLYDFLVLLPVFLGALTTIVVYLIVKKMGGTIAGLLASLVIAFSPPIIVRGNLGWFKSEPLALLLALLATYFFLCVYDTKTSSRGILLLGLSAGLLLGYSNTAWGGSQYFSIVFGLLLICTPFLHVDLERTVYAGSLLVAPSLLVSSIFPRPGPTFITSPVGLLLLASLFFVFIAYGVKKTVDPSNYSKTLAKVVFTLVLIGLLVVAFGLFSSVSGRYFTVINPFQRSADPLVESVAEHFVPTGSEYFVSYSILLFLSGFGAVTVFRKRSLYSAYALLVGLSAIYVASSFSRLMVYSSIAFAILGGMGFAVLTESLIRPSVVAAAKKKHRLYEVRTEAKVTYSVVMIVLLVTPLVYPAQSNWLSVSDSPVSLANAGTGFRQTFPDWIEALAWIRENTPSNAVLAAWWDYGYWITVIGNRTSLADNATINSTRIAQLGRMFMSNETQALVTLKDLRADYVVVFVVGQRIEVSGQSFYILGGGGDESKKQWFIQIGGLNMTQYLYEDDFTPRPYFWDSTFLGKLFPFTLFRYIDQSGNFQGLDYQQGYIGVYSHQIKYTESGKGPLRLVFESSSLRQGTGAGVFTGVLIYEIVE